jgi:Na+-transporting NADH:ubiquinone oxidoreductase subunit F
LRFVKLMHKWLGLIVGLQLLLWTVSGLMFSWLDHHEVQGGQVRRDPPPAVLGAQTPLAEPGAWLAEYGPADIRDIRLFPLLDQWAYRVELADRVELRRAADGKRFAIDATLARELASVHHASGLAPARVTLHEAGSIEARGKGSVWRTDFDGVERTSLYFSAVDGDLVAARNRTWRIFDFFWMLHTMDYRGRDDFNNPLVITAASAALWLAISGILLLSRSFRWGRLLPGIQKPHG